MEENIIGGVSPMKRRGKSRGKGRRGMGDTRYKRDKWVPPTSGGTITTPSDTLPPPPAKPYVIKDGKVEMTQTQSQTQGTPAEGHWKDKYKDVTTKTEKERSGYQDSYDQMEDRNGQKYNPRNKKLYDNFEQYKTEAKAWNEKNPGYKEYEEKTEKVLDGKEWVESKAATSGTQSQTQSQTSTNKMLGSPGKYRLGGYRAMKAFRK
mgnify:CR=1 FL=1|tara:strand:+ start:804 stop:1421 length:618 start_codon:yes stop_codon:yes gene_type:complete